MVKINEERCNENNVLLVIKYYILIGRHNNMYKPDTQQ